MGCDRMAKLKGKVYIPKDKKHDGEHYDSFESMIKARPDCQSEVDGEPSTHYTTVAEDESRSGEVDKAVV